MSVTSRNANRFSKFCTDRFTSKCAIKLCLNIAPHLKRAAALLCDLSLVTRRLGLPLFSDLNISQSSVATPLRCGAIFKHNFIAHLLVNLSVQNFENRLAFREVTDKSLVSCFLVHSIVLGDAHIFCRWRRTAAVRSPVMSSGGHG